VYAVLFRRLKNWEVVIPIILALNALTDLGTNYASAKGMDIDNALYYVLVPLEWVLTLLVYANNSRFKSTRFKNYVGVFVVIGIFIFALFYYPNVTEFPRGAYVWGGLVIALLSYIQLRSMALDEAGQSKILLVFTLANLIYFTLMISSQSAIDLAYELERDFGSNIYLINDISYALWSVILIFGILWTIKI
jgi:hypothetical protein